MPSHPSPSRLSGHLLRVTPTGQWLEWQDWASTRCWRAPSRSAAWPAAPARCPGQRPGLGRGAVAHYRRPACDIGLGALSQRRFPRPVSGAETPDRLTPRARTLGSLLPARPAKVDCSRAFHGASSRSGPKTPTTGRRSPPSSPRRPGTSPAACGSTGLAASITRTSTSSSRRSATVRRARRTSSPTTSRRPSRRCRRTWLIRRGSSTSRSPRTTGPCSARWRCRGTEPASRWSALRLG